MRTQRIITHLRCNQNCTYCTARSPADDPAFIAFPAVAARIDAALAAGAREILFTGGEPTMRGDLAALVAHARERGAERVAIETNAALIDPARARELHDAGATFALVNLAAATAALDAITRDPGGFHRTLAGLAALAGAGFTIEIQAAIVRSTLPHLAALPALLVRSLSANNPAHAIVATVPIDAPDPAELLSYDDAARALIALDDAARTVGIPLRLAPDSGPPPCALPPRHAHLYSLTRGAPIRSAHRKLDVCNSCTVSDRCSGLPEAHLARFPPPPMRPITEERVRRRLSLIHSVAEQVARELVSPNVYSDPERGRLEERIIRVNFHCNQACAFCFVSTHLPAGADEAVRTAIRAAAAAGAKIVLSGGEPTLNPSLPDYLRLAKSLSPLPVQLQTNAVRCDDPSLVAELRAAGLDQAFVSLHGATARVSDEVTCAPGTFDRTVAGIDALVAAGVEVVLNFVICQANHHELTDYVRLVAARWRSLYVNLSFIAPSADVVPRDRGLIPRYSDALPHLAAALAEATRLGVRMGGYQSMCGLPLCLVPGDFDRAQLYEIPPDFDGGEFVKPEPCTACALRDRCWGLRRGYAELHGTGELRAIPS